MANITDVLSTASIYISLLLTTGVKHFTHNDVDTVLSAEFTNNRERHVVQTILQGAYVNAIYYVENNLFTCYCIVMVEGQGILIGPYRTHQLKKSDFKKKNLLIDVEIEQYVQQQNMLPLIKEETIKLVAHAVFISLYGDSFFAPEHTVHLQEFSKNEVPSLDFEPEYTNMELAATRTMHSFSLLSALCEGNYVAAINIYDSILQTKKHQFVKLNAIEGLTSLRILASLAMNTSSVPTSSAYPLLREFKLKARTVSDKQSAQKLGMELIAHTCQLVRQQAGAKYSQTIKAAINYIHGNLSYPIAVDELADEVHMTPSSFSRRFRQEVGTTPVKYILRERLRQGSELLLYTNLGINEICTQVGMMDSNYFARCFRHEYGMSPTMYRKKSFRE